MRAMVTGFGPFQGFDENPSQVGVERLSGLGLQGLETRTLTVSNEAADAEVREIFRDPPDLLLLCGVAGNREWVSVERVAINVDDFRIPDVAGEQVEDMPVVEGGPVAYLSTLPIKDLVGDLKEAGLDGRISNTAGTYLCNHVMYLALHLAAEAGGGTRVGFLHVPPDPEIAVKAIEVSARMLLKR